MPRVSEAAIPAGTLDTSDDPVDGSAAAGSGSKMIAWLLGVSLFGLWTWWALAQGAFFPTVLLPGSMVLFLLAIVTFGLGRIPVAGRGPHVVAFVALIGFAAWTLLSVLWSPARDLALDYAQRDFAYAFAFGIGLVFGLALDRRLVLAALPFVGAGAIVVAVLLVKIKTADRLDPLIDDAGTLQFPFGYRNANSGFFVMLALGSIPLMVRRPGAVLTPAALAFLAATSGAVVVISQSRGSIVGVAAGALVLLIASRNRIATLLFLLAVAGSVAIFLPSLLDPYEAGKGADGLAQMKEAVDSSLAAGAVAAIVVAGLSLLRSRISAPTLRRLSPAATWAAIAALAVVAVAAFTVIVGSPIRYGEDGIDAITNGDRTYGKIEGSRFTYVGGLSRLNFWDVALDQAEADPIAGGGGGSFRSEYLVEGPGDFQPRNAHSLPLEVLGELGIVGLVLLLAGIGAAALAAVRSRSHGDDAAVLTATALVVATAMLAQASVDWSWYFAAQSAPMLALLGSAAAPAARGAGVLPAPPRAVVSGVAAVLALLAVPIFLAERLTLQAGRTWRSDTEGAYSDLDTAADLNPFADVPLLLKGAIAEDSGDDAVALAAAREAISRSPDNWRGHLLAAKALSSSDPQAALAAALRADELNPHSPEVNALLKRLRESTSPAPANESADHG